MHDGFTVCRYVWRDNCDAVNSYSDAIYPTSVGSESMQVLRSPGPMVSCEQMSDSG